MVILAIDLGQRKSVFCRFDGETGEYRFGAFQTSRERLRRG